MSFKKVISPFSKFSEGKYTVLRDNPIDMFGFYFVKSRVEDKDILIFRIPDFFFVPFFHLFGDSVDGFGIVFKGNPDLSPLFLHNWKDLPPLRKDFDTEEYSYGAFDVGSREGEK